MLKIEIQIENCPFCFNKIEYTCECLSIKGSDNHFYVNCDSCNATSPLSSDIAHVTDEWNIVSLATQAAFKVKK